MIKTLSKASVVCALCLPVFGNGAGGQVTPRDFSKALALEDAAETSANVSVGDLDADGDLDLVLAKGRHWPLRDRVLLNDGKGAFAATDLGPIADRTYSAVLADFDGDGDLDVATSNDRPDTKLVFLNDGRARFVQVGVWGAPEMVHTERDGRRSQRRRQARSHRRQSAGAELCVSE